MKGIRRWRTRAWGSLKEPTVTYGRDTTPVPTCWLLTLSNFFPYKKSTKFSKNFRLHVHESFDKGFPFLLTCLLSLLLLLFNSFFHFLFCRFSANDRVLNNLNSSKFFNLLVQFLSLCWLFLQFLFSCFRLFLLTSKSHPFAFLFSSSIIWPSFLGVSYLINLFLEFGLKELIFFVYLIMSFV